MYLKNNMGNLTDWLMLALSFISGACVALWKVFDILSRLSVIEKEITNLKQYVLDLKNEIYRDEDKIDERLSSIENELRIKE